MDNNKFDIESVVKSAQFNPESVKVDWQKPTPAENLAQSVYSDPKTFMATFEKDFDRIPQKHKGLLTKEDLTNYAQNGSDPEAKAIAGIASKHFEDIQNLSVFPRLNALDLIDSGKGHWTWQGKIQGLSKHDIEVDKDMAAGDVEGYIHMGQAVGTTDIGAATFISQQLAIRAAAALPVPPLAIVLGAGAAAAGAFAVDDAINTAHYSSRFHEKNAADRKMLSSWSEINQGATK